MADLGISLRLIREWKPEPEPVLSMFDKAFILAMGDDREDVAFAQKLTDAMQFLKLQIH